MKTNLTPKQRHRLVHLDKKILSAKATRTEILEAIDLKRKLYRFDDPAECHSKGMQILAEGKKSVRIGKERINIGWIHHLEKS